MAKQRRQNRNKSQKITRSPKISEHFSRKDFECRCGACKSSLRISLGLVGGLELLRSITQKRINILKGYECPKSSEQHGKVKRNYHTMGLAVDIAIPGLSPQEIFLAAEQVPEFKGIGMNLDKDFVRIDTRKEPERKIWAEKDGQETLLSDDTKSSYFSLLPTEN